MEQHCVLGQMLDRVQETAAAMLAAGSNSVERAVGLGRELYTGLLEKIELEDQMLLPALREADAWGEIRAAELGRLLAAQRRDLEAMPLQEDPMVEPTVIVARLLSVIEIFRVHMLREEAFALAPDLLRDDIYGIDVEDG
jgi:hypothetical protein